MHKTYEITEIAYDTFDEEVDDADQQTQSDLGLPSTLEITVEDDDYDEYEIDEILAEEISAHTGYLVHGFNRKLLA